MARGRWAPPVSRSSSSRPVPEWARACSIRPTSTAGAPDVPEGLTGAVFVGRREGGANVPGLVVIHLAGGRDGLPALVRLAGWPLRDPRPKMAGPIVTPALALTKDFGLNHNLGGIK